jgi:hypothetical protein
MEKLIQILINKAYRYHRDNYYSRIKQQLFPNKKFFRLFDAGIKENLLVFAGFEVSYDSYGSKLSQKNEIWEGTYLTQHNIYLNKHFLLNLLGYCNENKIVGNFTFDKLIETIAHEVAHALLVDFYPDEKEHDDKHEEITKELQEYLLSMPLVEKWREKIKFN